MWRGEFEMMAGTYRPDDASTPLPPSTTATTTTTTTTARTTTATLPPALVSPPTKSAALAAFRAGAMDGEAGREAGRVAANAVLGRSAKAGDGWDNEEDMQDGTIDEAGSRARRNALPNGRCVSSREFRATKEAQGTSATDAAAALKLKGFKTRRLALRVLEENTLAETRLAAGDKLSQALTVAYIRARTDKPVGLKGEEALLRGLEAVRGKPLAIRTGMEPDSCSVAWSRRRLRVGQLGRRVGCC